MHSDHFFYQVARRHLGLLLIAGLLICGSIFLFLENYTYPISSVLLQDSAGTTQSIPISLPFQKPEMDPLYQLAKYTITFEHHTYFSDDFTIIPDDCVRKITLNSKAIDLRKFDASRLCNYISGFNMDLSSDLSGGLNTLVLEVENTGGAYGLNIVLHSIFYFLSCMSFFVAALLTTYFISRKVGLSRATAFILLSAVPYFLFWLHYFPNLYYTTDLYGHIGYISYISTHWTNPYEYWGRENWHPPLYYYLTALAYNLSSYITHDDPLTVVRLISLMFYMTFCIYGVRTLRAAFLNENQAYYVGVLLIIFWPVSMIMATRINNDIALYAVWSTMFYYLAQWYKEQNIKLLHYTIIALGISFMIKSNSVILLAIVCAIITFSLISGRLLWKHLFLRSHLPALGILLLGIIINVGKMIYVNLSHGKNISGTHFGETAHDAISLCNFVKFYMIQYITTPFNIIYKEPTFLNYFLKTMLYGEYTWKYSNFASVINIFLIVFLLIMVCATMISILCKRQRFIDLAPYIVSFIIPLLGVMAFYAIKKMSACQDFRFVLPMLVPMVILYVKSVDSLYITGKARALYWAGIMVGLLFPIAGVIFYIAQYLYR